MVGCLLRDLHFIYMGTDKQYLQIQIQPYTNKDKYGLIQIQFYINTDKYSLIQIQSYTNTALYIYNAAGNLCMLFLSSAFFYFSLLKIIL